MWSGSCPPTGQERSPLYSAPTPGRSAKPPDSTPPQRRPNDPDSHTVIQVCASATVFPVAEKSKVIAVKVDPELWAKVRAKADDKSVSVSALLRRSLEKWVEA